MTRMFLLLALFFQAANLMAVQPLKPKDVPEPLQPWINWVLSDYPEQACSPAYNDGAKRFCSWPGQLQLELSRNGGEFHGQWLLQKPGAILLPGSPEHSPESVAVDGQPAVVTWQGGRPRLMLDPGSYSITGRFHWRRLPQTLAVPPATATLEVILNGNKLSYPRMNNRGELWLGDRQQGQEDVENSLDIQVFRRVTDSVPMRLMTRVQLQVSGRNRELELARILPEGFIPVSVSSRLPVQVTPQGDLQVQLGAGNWQLDVEARQQGQTNQVTLAAIDQPWPDSEVWVFDAETENRLVEVEGVTPVDPRQTLLPDNWKQLPAYRLSSGDTLSLKVIRRGNADPEPDNLQLERRMWLDFDGSGYTIQDRISGTMQRGWRLTTLPEMILGRVAVDNEPQLVTLLDDRRGVELRHGQVTVDADSRLNSEISEFPATGWQHAFNRLSATLQLPPGWKLMGAAGVDHASGSWSSRWTLLDLFLVLVTAIAVARLWAWHWGLVALLGLVFIWQENGAPHFVWLHIVAAIALLRVLPQQGRAGELVRHYRNLAVVVLLLIAIPFAIQQLRTGLFPQLGMQGRPVVPEAVKKSARTQAEQEAGSTAPMPLQAGKEAISYSRVMDAAVPSAPTPVFKNAQQPETTDRVDPEARIQTGPGLPDWRWQKHRLSWNGPVEADQRVSLWLLSPAMVLLLQLLQIALVGLFVVLIIRNIASEFRQYAASAADSAGKAAGMALLVLFGLPAAGLVAGDVQAGEMPTRELLDELRTRLTAPAACLPECAHISLLQIQLQEDGKLQLQLEVHAEEPVAVPLPGKLADWMPVRITDNGKPLTALKRDGQGVLHAGLTEGVHQLQMEGPVAAVDSFVLTLPLVPKRVVPLRLGDWQLEGLHQDDLPERQLRFFRQPRESGANKRQESVVLPAWFRVRRTLRFGLDWEVFTEVTRLSPAGSTATTRVPLLEGESVTTAGVTVDARTVRVSMSAGQSSYTWRSRLEQQPQLKLTAADSPDWHEVWAMDISPVWHPVIEGIPMNHQQRAGRWFPEWYPWAGDTLTLQLARLAGADGGTLTIDESRLKLTPGKRSAHALLELEIRSSQGGQHTITLPESAELQSVTQDGRRLPVRQNGQHVTLPLLPRSQLYHIEFKLPLGIETLYRSPQVDLGIPSVNSHSQIELGQDRWLLWARGPSLGPAVQFWGMVIVAAVIAWGLGRLKITPLGHWQWFLLLIGLLQIKVAGVLVVVATLLALGWHSTKPPASRAEIFNFRQIVLSLLVLLSVILLYQAVQQGLLGSPDMQVAGNGSSGGHLSWYQDHSLPLLPEVQVISVSLLVYRLLMLAWSLWLAWALLNWVRWGWRCYSAHGLWRHVPAGERKKNGRQPMITDDSASSNPPGEKPGW